MRTQCLLTKIKRSPHLHLPKPVSPSNANMVIPFLAVAAGGGLTISAMLYFKPVETEATNFLSQPMVSKYHDRVQLMKFGAASCACDEQGVPKPNAYVLVFDGDATASQVTSLREEVTAVITNCVPNRGDQVILILKSGGGTVQGYGLATAQLERLKCAGLPLTVCVDEVAASGGYLMACVADRIVASRFSQIGSIGVVSTMINYHALLDKFGIIVHEVAAGAHKRQLSPTKKISQQDVNETKDDLENIFQLFKATILRHRPTVDILKVANGKVWCGEHAMKLGLVDEIGVSDDVLLRLHIGTWETPTLNLHGETNNQTSVGGCGAAEPTEHEREVRQGKSKQTQVLFVSWNTMSASASASTPSNSLCGEHFIAAAETIFNLMVTEAEKLFSVAK
jgi:serine protease SohB